MATQPQLRTPGWRTSETRGEPIEAYGREITPIGRVLQVRWPGGGYTWHRPVAIEASQGDEVYRLPIHDVTMRSIIMMALTGLTCVALVSLWRRGISTRRRNRL
jgi:hypothetical protein